MASQTKRNHLPSYAIPIVLLSISSVFIAVVPVKGQSNQIQVDFSFTNKWGTYQATGYYVEGTTNAPVVVFLHGTLAYKEMYNWLIAPYLNAGYVLVMFNIPSEWSIRDLVAVESGKSQEFGPSPDGFSPCIDALGSLENLIGVADLALIAATGHSGGALGAMVAATQDSRIRAVVALSPPIHEPSLPHPTKFNIPIQLQVGSNEAELYDGIVRYYNQELDAPIKDLVVIPGGNHIQFMDESTVGLLNTFGKIITIPFVGNQPAGISIEEQHSLSSKASLSFLSNCFQNVPLTPIPEFSGPLPATGVLALLTMVMIVAARRKRIRRQNTEWKPDRLDEVDQCLSRCSCH